MKPAYIISAYRRPDLLLRLVDDLGSAPVAIHIDRKAISINLNKRTEVLKNVKLLDRHICYWGGFGHVAASIEGLRWFQSTGADYVILLTGSCFPLLTQSEIRARLDQLSGRSLMEITPFPKSEWARENGGYKRLDRFFVRIPGRKRPHGLQLWKRSPPLGLHPFGGGSYWCLSRACAEYLLKYIGDNPQVTRFFRTTYVPDEMFFHTILGNSPLAPTIENFRIHYTDWSGGGTGPAVLTEASLTDVLGSDAWFARKFDDLAVMSKIAELR